MEFSTSDCVGPALSSNSSSEGSCSSEIPSSVGCTRAYSTNCQACRLRLHIDKKICKTWERNFGLPRLRVSEITENLIYCKTNLQSAMTSYFQDLGEAAPSVLNSEVATSLRGWGAIIPCTAPRAVGYFDPAPKIF